MKKGILKKVVIVAITVAVGITAGVIVGREKGLGSSEASCYEHGYDYEFENMHMTNYYQSGEEVVNGQKMKNIKFEIYVSKEYAGTSIFLELKDPKTKEYIENVKFQKTREENGGYIYSAIITKPEGTKYISEVYNYTNMHYLVDKNGGCGYELNF